MSKTFFSFPLFPFLSLWWCTVRTVEVATSMVPAVVFQFLWNYLAIKCFLFVWITVYHLLFRVLRSCTVGILGQGVKRKSLKCSKFVMASVSGPYHLLSSLIDWKPFILVSYAYPRNSEASEVLGLSYQNSNSPSKVKKQFDLKSRL